MPKRNIENQYVSSSHSVYKDVKNLVKQLRWVHASSRPSRSTSSTATESAKKTQSKAWDFMGRLVKEEGSDLSPTFSASTAQNVTLNFCTDHARALPKFSCIARVFLAIHAGSVPVECLFSTTGLYIAF